MKKYLTLVAVLFIFLNSFSQDEEGEDGFVMKVRDSKNYDLSIDLSNGKQINTMSKFMIDYCNKVMFVYDQSEFPVYPQNTYSMTRLFKDGTELKGFPTDSLWIFQTIPGKLSGFAVKPEKKLKHLEYLTIDGSDLIKYSEDTLRSLIAKNIAASNAFNKVKSQRKISNILTLAGFAGLLTSIYAPKMFEIGATDIPPMAVLGFAIGSGGVYMKSRSKKNLRNVFDIYNSRE